MAKAKKKAKAKTKKKKYSAEELSQRHLKRRHFSEVRSVFSVCGFKRVPAASDKEFTYEGTTSDLDDIFIRDNIVVLSECTTSQSSDISVHLKKKKVLYDKILADTPKFLDFLATTFPDFAALRNPKFQPHHYRTIILYCPRSVIDSDLKTEVPSIKYFDYHIVRYFKTIADRVKTSARFEFFSFLGLGHKDIGDNVLSTAAVPTVSFRGSILPEGQSHFPPGFKVASFYVDPNTLLQRCYVLRKDGWGDESSVYQRMISKSKIESIRKYLLSKRRVFINNIVVTLPNTTQLTKDNGQTLNPSTIHQTEPGNIQLPSEYNSIGMIDGQHRVFSYYEGGKDEAEIALLRVQQNLLVTGVIYPPSLSPKERSKFEATLFLEINSTQTNAKSELRQAIGVLLHPYSADSIARRVVLRLNEQGALIDRFERFFFDKGKIKTTTIVSYGLKPILKTSGADTLFAAWPHKDKLKLIDEPTDALVGDYIAFCTKEINTFIGAVKSCVPADRWTTDKKVKGRMLTTTIINGLIVCLRSLAENNKLHSFDWYRSRFVKADLSKFAFSDYKSSQYGSLGDALYKKYFS